MLNYAAFTNVSDLGQYSLRKVAIMSAIFIFVVILTVVILQVFNVIPPATRESIVKFFSDPIVAFVSLISSVILGVVGAIMIFASKDIYAVSIGLAVMFFATVLLLIAISTSINVLAESVRSALEGIMRIFRGITG